MALTVSAVYSVRDLEKLPLPKLVQDNIAKLRITPMVFKPFHKPAPRPFHPKKSQATDNWRERMLVDIVRRVKEREDPEYSDIFAIFNKITASSVEKLTKDAIERIQKRDETFRLRIATLLFDKAITNHGFASVMAESARIMVAEIPDMKEDIQTQVSMFPKLYNMNETLTFPTSADSDFDNKVIEWTKQKEKRRGYAKFLMELCLRDLVSDECVKSGLQDVLNELNDVAKQPRTAQTEENVNQYAVFLYESAKLSKSASIRSFIADSLKSVLAIDKMSLPSLNMRSRFKLEDAFKLVQ
jgi:hypothetical protein